MYRRPPQLTRVWTWYKPGCETELGRHALPTPYYTVCTHSPTAGSARYLFDGQSTSRLRELGPVDNAAEEPVFDGPAIASLLTATGQVTALGDVLSDIRRQPGQRHLAAVVLVSDFVQNTGTHPLAGAALDSDPLRELGVPVHTVAVGSPVGRDVAIDLDPEPRVRRGEEVLLKVRLRQTQLGGQTVSLRVQATSPALGEAIPAVDIASRTVTLDASEMYLDIPFVPAQTGLLDLVAEVAPVPGEAVRENNRATRRIQVVEDFVRVLYVAHEPTWEWRFIKEILHRDAAVGVQGFRTYLASSDPRVRQANPLFLPTLAQPPQTFHANDVVFLDDFPAAALTPHFCAMLEHFVAELGGGLVVIAGPRFGPQQLAETPLAAMLPVVLDPQSRMQDRTEFALQLTPHAAQYRFMQLDDDPRQNRRAWAKLSRLAWYQPVANQHEQATVLAQHPVHTCRDGTTLQPLIAIRRYGAGEVLYVGFNEMWRLRRLDGERHYSRFWLPLVDRLGLSHALGAQKRFVVRTDRVRYRLGDDVQVTIHAYDAEYQPLEPEQLESQTLSGELVRLAGSQEDEVPQQLRFGHQRSGVYGTQLPAVAAGDYLLRVQDPITGSTVQQSFEVFGGSAELLAPTRDDDLARRLAAQSGGTFRSLQNIQTLPDHIDLQPVNEESQLVFPLWNTPFWFIWIVTLMFGEWLLRKWMNLV